MAKKKKTQNIICPICQQNTVIKNICNNNNYNTFDDITYILDDSKHNKNILRDRNNNNKYNLHKYLNKSEGYVSLESNMEPSPICCVIL